MSAVFYVVFIYVYQLQIIFMERKKNFIVSLSEDIKKNTGQIYDINYE